MLADIRLVVDVEKKGETVSWVGLIEVVVAFAGRIATRVLPFPPMRPPL